MPSPRPACACTTPITDSRDGRHPFCEETKAFAEGSAPPCAKTPACRRKVSRSSKAAGACRPQATRHLRGAGSSQLLQVPLGPTWVDARTSTSWQNQASDELAPSWPTSTLSMRPMDPRGEMSCRCMTQPRSWKGAGAMQAGLSDQAGMHPCSS